MLFCSLLRLEELLAEGGDGGCGASLGPRESGRRWVPALRGDQGPLP